MGWCLEYVHHFSSTQKKARWKKMKMKKEKGKRVAKKLHNQVQHHNFSWLGWHTRYLCWTKMLSKCDSGSFLHVCTILCFKLYPLIVKLPFCFLLRMLVDGVSLCMLCYLMKKTVFSFFLASHTNIWSQPSDGGVNKQFKHAIEESCSTMCCEYDSVTIAYFNKHMQKGQIDTTLNEQCNKCFHRMGLYQMIQTVNHVMCNRDLGT